MPAPINRRDFLRATAATAGAGIVLGRVVDAAPPPATPFTLGFSLYGMNGLPLDEALRHASEIGFLDVEPALMPGYSGDPAKLGKPRRLELRKLLDSLGLAVGALMENLRP